MRCTKLQECYQTWSAAIYLGNLDRERVPRYDYNLIVDYISTYEKPGKELERIYSSARYI